MSLLSLTWCHCGCLHHAAALLFSAMKPPYCYHCYDATTDSAMMMPPLSHWCWHDVALAIVTTAMKDAVTDDGMMTPPSCWWWHDDTSAIVSILLLIWFCSLQPPPPLSSGLSTCMHNGSNEVGCYQHNRSKHYCKYSFNSKVFYLSDSCSWSIPRKTPTFGTIMLCWAPNNIKICTCSNMKCLLSFCWGTPWSWRSKHCFESFFRHLSPNHSMHPGVSQIFCLFISVVWVDKLQEYYFFPPDQQQALLHHSFLLHHLELLKIALYCAAIYCAWWNMLSSI